MTYTDSIKHKFNTANFSLLDAVISPIDGRYAKQTSALRNYFSTPALNRARVYVEIQWLIALSDGISDDYNGDSQKNFIDGLQPLTSLEKDVLFSIVQNFDATSAAKIEEIEQTTKHDVKAVEYFIKGELKALFDNSKISKQTFETLHQAVHIFCTSEDINNLSYAIIIKAAVFDVWLPKLLDFVEILKIIANKYKSTAMLAKTHGQPATPTTLGKEIAVFAHRLERQISKIKNQEFLGKINGATGTFGAHYISVKNDNWPEFAKNFVENYLNLDYNPLTTQIESHDWQAELYSLMQHVNRILHNFATDIWLYIMEEMFIQIPEANATGSSTMPHKINPIKFENAEANLEISDAIFSKLSETLTISRLQRDLTDSSTQRNVGVAFAHSLIALDNLISGVEKLEVNEVKLTKQLDENSAVLGEAVQTVMRVKGINGLEGMENPYERLKSFSRGQEITLQQMREFINSVSFDEHTKNMLLQLTPNKYIGLAEKLTEEYLNNK